MYKCVDFHSRDGAFALHSTLLFNKSLISKHIFKKIFFSKVACKENLAYKTFRDI